jgi:ribonuclease D
VSDPNLQDHYLDTPEALAAWLSRLPQGDGVRVALDTEADSLHSYREKLCLIQMGVGEYKALIDPLNITDLTPLLTYLEKAEIWVHGADLDMTLMKRTFGVIPERLYDTQVAARLTGERQFGLAHLVESKFGVQLSKQSQRADWGRRPLTPKMIEYALNDIHYVIPLADMFMTRLRELGREPWFLENCADARLSVLHRPPPDPDEQWRINGSGALKPCGLHYLRAFWQWRDKEAERLNRPTFKVISNDEIIAMAQALQEGKDVTLPSRYPPPVHRRFYKALKDAKAIPETDWPRRPSRRRHDRDIEAEKRFDVLKERRDKIGIELNLDPALIASRASLERIAREATAVGELLLNWQRELLAI